MWTRVARFTMLVCLWMCTVGTVAHNDGALFATSKVVASIGHASPPPPVDECAACQWASSIQTGNFHVVSVPIPTLHTLGSRHPLVESLTSVAVRFTPLRGPPTSPLA
jgi:hypothetical protein